MKISCRQCGATVLAQDIDLERNIAKCASCGEVFNCADELFGVASVVRTKRGDVPMPKGFAVVTDEKGLLITRKWFTWAALFLTFFCVFWDGFLVFWYAAAITQKIWIMAIFAIGHAAVGVGLTYYTIALYVNKTYIRVGQGILSIEHNPLPFGRRKEFEAYRIRGIYTQQKVSQGKNGEYTTYHVFVKIQDQKDQSLVKNLTEENQAFFIEQEVERYLGVV